MYYYPKASNCYKCQDRYVGCHSKCEKYAAYSKGLSEFIKNNERERALKAVDGARCVAKKAVVKNNNRKLNKYVGHRSSADIRKQELERDKRVLGIS